MKNPAFSSIRGPDPANIARATWRWANYCARDAFEACSNVSATRAFVTVFTLILALVFNLMAPFEPARAQQAGLMSNGDLAVTGFSGTTVLGGQTFIDTNGASLKILDVSGKGAAKGQLVNSPAKFEAFARDIGQVFGVALDNAPNPNIYATATSVHGLRIVIPDNNGDGVPEVVQTGQAGASFMDGQFGAALGGGPGTVWRIDGTTGEITKFAEITAGGLSNSGPGLGNITFDPAHYQFYVSDLDTGNIHRLDLAGNDLGSFDHGTQGRPLAGLAPVGVDVAKRMDITSAAFDTANPATWGLADERRRVWGLAYYSGRLYYAVASGSQIWSVGINNDGTFAGDARIEIDAVEGGKPVSDILFTPQGRMIVAQRGGIQNSNDYSLYHIPSDNRVLRYSRDVNGQWIQQADEYAIGFPVDHKQASGGVGLACDGTLWSTGDALRNDPLAVTNAPYVVHGLQGNNVSLVRPFNVPPHSSWFVDYDNFFEDPEKAGHVGDVEVYRNCAGDRAESWPGWYPIPEWTPPHGWIPPVWWPRDPDLDIYKFAQQCEYVPAFVNTVECKYTIVVTNNGAADWVGHLNVTDNPQANASFIPPAGGSIPWTCNQPGGAGTAIDCVSDNVETLHPGESETLEITVQIVNPVQDKLIRNCAEVDDPFDFWPNEDCDETGLPRPDLQIQKIFSNCVPEGAFQRCFFFFTFENVGGAPYTGPLQFEEHVPAGTIFGGIFGSTTPGWGCIGGNPITCTLPDPPGVTLNGPGDFEIVGISILVPFNGGQTDYENCVDLGSGEHGDDPVAPGVNNSCVPFQVAWFVPKCPAGWQEMNGPLPAGWQAIAVHGFHPDGTPWALMCMRPKPLEEQAGPLPPKPDDIKQPEPKPQCLPNEKRFNKKSLIPSGWQSRKVTVGNTTIWCAKPGRVIIPLPNCRKGETKFSNPGQIPSGWARRAVTRGNVTIWCAKPGLTIPLPNCRKGEKQFSNPAQIPSGWTRRAVTRGNVTIWCAKPGLTIPLPNCRKGETKFSNPAQIPSGWTRRKVTLGKFSVWCAKPGLTTPDPIGPKCAAGEKQVSSPRTAPKGWKVRTVTLGKRTIYCAKPGTLIPLKPRCVGGKLVMLKTMPPRWSCICPQGKKLVNGVCKTNILQSTPEIKPCPKGWSRVRGKCIPPKLQVKPIVCPKGWNKVKGKCIPPKLQTVPKVKPCPKGWSRVRGKCVPPKLQINPNLKVKPKAQLKPKRNTGKVMMLAPSNTLKSGPSRKFR